MMTTIRGLFAALGRVMLKFLLSCCPLAWWNDSNLSVSHRHILIWGCRSSVAANLQREWPPTVHMQPSVETKEKRMAAFYEDNLKRRAQLAAFYRANNVYTGKSLREMDEEDENEVDDDGKEEEEDETNEAEAKGLHANNGGGAGASKRPRPADDDDDEDSDGKEKPAKRRKGDDDEGVAQVNEVKTKEEARDDAKARLD